ncbi:MAG: hypothetical protein JWR35_792 [Marmoricola sp.]|jgi:hypothetical protein|nr:hypothetical protein [Marmoricola sp.]
MSINISPAVLAAALRRELLRLARAEEDRAAAEAAKVPYWATCPPSVQGHRAAAGILRATADSFLATAEFAS